MAPEMNAAAHAAPRAMWKKRLIIRMFAITGVMMAAPQQRGSEELRQSKNARVDVRVTLAAISHARFFDLRYRR
jgi:hypothetical protein